MKNLTYLGIPVGLLGLVCWIAQPRVEAAEDYAPFPAGENAALVKKVCTECHSANLVVSTQFDEELATRQYKKFVGDPNSEEGRKVIKYLVTYLGEK